MTILLRCLLLYLPTSFVLPSHFHLLNDLTNVFLVCSYSWIVVLLQIFLKHQGGKHYKKKNHIILWKRITISHPLKIDYFPFSISWHKYKVNINQARYNWVVDSGGILNFLYMSFFLRSWAHTQQKHTPLINFQNILSSKYKPRTLEKLFNWHIVSNGKL